MYGYRSVPRNFELDECLRPVDSYAIGYVVETIFYSPVEKFGESGSYGPIPAEEELACPT